MNAEQGGHSNSASRNQDARSNNSSRNQDEHSNSIAQNQSNHANNPNQSERSSNPAQKQIGRSKIISQKPEKPMNTSPPIALFGRFFATDMRRIFTETTFLTSLFLGILTFIIPFVLLFRGGDSVSAGFVSAQSTVFPFVAPFLAALPFAGMHKTEVETKYSDLLKLRRGGRDYSFTRFITVGISGGLVLLFAELFLLLVTFITIYTDSISDYRRIAAVVVLTFPFGIAFASAAQAVTVFTRSKTLAVITPEVLYLLFTYSFPYVELHEYYPPLAISPFIYGEPNFGRIIAFFTIIILLSLIVTIIDKVKST
jgi:hypothetical protein